MDHRISKDMISSGMTPSGEKAQEDLGRTQYGSNPSPSSLADAYKSMYGKKEEVINAHHKKDADGNTIPHEGEEINEVVFTGGAMLAGLAAKKLLGAAAAKGLKAGATAFTKKALVKTMGMGSRGALKTISKKGVAGAADKALGSAAMSTVKNPVNTMVGASLLKPTPKIPTPIDRSKKMTGARTAGVYASADLFDIVKGQLLDEGIDEKDALKIMVELSQQDLNTIVNEGVGKMLLKTAAVSGGLVAANQALKKGKEKFDKFINKKRDEGIGGNTRPGSDKIYFGK